MSREMIYLASPYSHPDRNLVNERVGITRQCCAALINKKFCVWSPILMTHGIAYGLPTDAKFWMEYNFDFIRRCEYIFVLKIPGWDTSVGVAEEIAVAKSLFIPVRFVDAFGDFIE